MSRQFDGSGSDTVEIDPVLITRLFGVVATIVIAAAVISTSEKLTPISPLKALRSRSP